MRILDKIKEYQGFVILLLIVGAVITSIPIIMIIQDLEHKRANFNIEIREDADFEKYNLRGNGTKANPYLIENYRIDTEEYWGIIVVEVSKYFIIRNNYVKSAGGAIAVYRVILNYTLIEYNLCENSYYGIRIGSGTENIIVRNNTCRNNNDGISIDSRGFSPEPYLCTIVNNTVVNNHFTGIKIQASNCLIENNYIQEEEWERGIELYDSHNITLRNNHIRYHGLLFTSGGSGSYWTNSPPLEYFLSTTLDNNYVDGKIITLLKNKKGGTINIPEHGQLILVNCSDMIIHNQIFIERWRGLSVIGCNNLTIFNNKYYNNSVGLYLHDSNNISLYNNHYEGNYEGFHISKAIIGLISNETFIDNYLGSEIAVANISIISSRYDFNSKGIQIIGNNLRYSNYSITNSSFTNNIRGCLIYGNSDGTIKNCSFIKNRYGFDMDNWILIRSLHFISNSTFEHNFNGLRTEFADISINSNYFNNNTYGCLFTHNTLFTLDNNVFTNNENDFEIL